MLKYINRNTLPFIGLTATLVTLAVVCMWSYNAGAPVVAIWSIILLSYTVGVLWYRVMPGRLELTIAAQNEANQWLLESLDKSREDNRELHKRAMDLQAEVDELRRISEN